MNEDQSTLDFEFVKTWSVKALKEYLKDRGIKVSGTKEMLQARVFTAQELNLPKVLSEAERDKVRNAEYTKLLYVDGETLPDPFYELPEGWLSEHAGIHLWPPTDLKDIETYLNRFKPGPDRKLLNDKLLCD